MQSPTGDFAKNTKKRKGAARVFAVIGIALLTVLIFALTVNALLSAFADSYYPTFGDRRLFSVTSDSMDPEIPKGYMIAAKIPTDTGEIRPSTSRESKDGTVITYKFKTADGETVLITHRVVEVISDANGETVYTTRGDNAAEDDPYKPKWRDVVGIYTGRKCAFFGSLFGFLKTGFGISLLLFLLASLAAALFVGKYYAKYGRRKALETAALKKGTQALSNVSLRYDNVHEITAVMDVLGMVTEQPKTRSESKRVAERLNEFIGATNFELPQTPETAAMLDSLPAPDTPASLAAALSVGATLRQAEDGQTLVLTTLSGDKHIMLTPVQTADGIILCQQGVRLRADIAPNLEEIGETSIPTAPDFFIGQPLEKNIIYPELPEPNVPLGPDRLFNGKGAFDLNIPVRQAALSTPVSANVAAAEVLSALPGGAVEIAPGVSASPVNILPPAQERERLPKGGVSDSADNAAFTEYRTQSALLELEQAEQLNALLSSAVPLSPDEQAKINEYRTAHKKEGVKRPSKPLTDEQRAKRKADAERKKADKQAFLDSLDERDRELYFAEQKLIKSRAQTIRRLKRMAADRKLLEKL